MRSSALGSQVDFVFFPHPHLLSLLNRVEFVPERGPRRSDDPLQASLAATLLRRVCMLPQNSHLLLLKWGKLMALSLQGTQEGLEISGVTLHWGRKGRRGWDWKHSSDRCTVDLAVVDLVAGGQDNTPAAVLEVHIKWVLLAGRRPL